jgi:hypothetical protein
MRTILLGLLAVAGIAIAHAYCFARFRTSYC